MTQGYQLDQSYYTIISLRLFEKCLLPEYDALPCVLPVNVVVNKDADEDVIKDVIGDANKVVIKDVDGCQ